MKVIGSFFEQFEGEVELGPYDDAVHTASTGDTLIVADASGCISLHAVENPTTVRYQFFTASPLVLDCHYVELQDVIATLENDGSRNHVMLYSGWRDDEELTQLHLPHSGNCTCLSSCPVTGTIAIASAARITLHVLQKSGCSSDGGGGGGGGNAGGTSTAALAVVDLLSLVPLVPPISVRLCNGVIAYCSGEEALALKVTLQPTVEEAAIGASGESQLQQHQQQLQQQEQDTGSNGSRSDILTTDKTCSSSSTSSSSSSSSSCTVLGFDTTGQPWDVMQTLSLGLPGPGLDARARAIVYGPQPVANHNLRMNPDSGYTFVRLEQLLHQACEEGLAFNSLRLIPVCDLSAVHLGPEMIVPARVPGSLRNNPLLCSDSRLSGVHCFVSHERCGWMHSLTGTPELISEYVYNLSDNATAAVASSTMMFVTMTGGGQNTIHAMSIRTLAPSQLDDGLETVPDVLWLGVQPLPPGCLLSVTASPHLLSVTRAVGEQAMASRGGGGSGGALSGGGRGDSGSIPLVGSGVGVSNSNNSSSGSGGGSGAGGGGGGGGGDNGANSPGAGLQRKYMVTLLKRISPMGLYEQMTRFAQTTPKQHPNVKHMLYDAQYLLRLQTSQLLLAGADCSRYVQALRRSCGLVAEQQREAASPNWQRVASQYVAADTPLEDIVAALCPASYNGKDDWVCAAVDIGPAHALGTLLEAVLLETRHLDRCTAPVEMARIMLHMVYQTRPEDLALLIIALASQLELVPVITVEGAAARRLLKKTERKSNGGDAGDSKGSKGNNRGNRRGNRSGVVQQQQKEDSTEQSVALGLIQLYLHNSSSNPHAAVDSGDSLDTTDISAATNTLLLTDPDWLEARCLAHPALLVKGIVADPAVPAEAQYGNLSLQQVSGGSSSEISVVTPLAEHLRVHAPDFLARVLLGMGNTVTAATCLRLLGPNAHPARTLQLLRVHISNGPSARLTSVTQTAWIYLKRLGSTEEALGYGDVSTGGGGSGGESGGGGRLPALVPSGARYDWLDALPPFAMGYAPGLGASAEALGTLRHLQAYLSTELTQEEAPYVLALVESPHSERVPGRLALRLLCLQVLGQQGKTALELLLDASPALCLPYLRGRETQVKPSLLQDALKILLNRIATLDADTVDITAAGAGAAAAAAAIATASATASATGAVAVAAATATATATAIAPTPAPAGPSRCDFVAAYTDLLSHAASTLDPKTFLSLLPDAGNVDFYLPFLDRACRQDAASVLARAIEVEAHNFNAD